MSTLYNRSSRLSRSNESDRQLTGLFLAAYEKWLGESGRTISGVALAAVGGYGRGELCPGSDLDILILHNGQFAAESLLGFVNALLYPIWDGATASSEVPRSLDHSVRTRNETRMAAHSDLKVAMGLLDIRLICGDATLVAAVQHDAIDDWHKDAQKRLPNLRAMLEHRHERAGELAFLLEPDLKEARGGLRDITALRAIAKTGVIDVALERINRADQVLSDIREALHGESKRFRDRLLFQEQDKVASALGYTDADEMMGAVAQSARDVDYLMTLTWHRFTHRGKDGLGRILRRPRTTMVARDISVAHHEVIIDIDAPFDDDPLLGLRAAKTAAQLGLPLSLDSCLLLSRSIKDGHGDIPNPWPRQAREDLVSLIGAGSAMVQVWEALDQEEIITRWLPEWAAVRSLPQRNVMHRHTVDRHMVETAVHAAAFTRSVHRPDLLLVAALFHDIGKGAGEDHSGRGARLIEPLARRIGFSEVDVETLRLLVHQHLLLSSTATRRDLGDPATIAAVLAIVPDLETLELLHALTVADGEATGSGAWSDWKATLVGDLVHRVRAAMSGSIVAQQPELNAEQRGFAEVGALRVNVAARESDYEIEIIAPDKPGLLSIIAGVLNLARLDVRSARTKSHGASAVMQWIVTLDPHAPIPTAAKLHRDIDGALHGQIDLDAKIRARMQTYARLPSIPVPPPRVEVFHQASMDSTVFEVRSHDRPGLLFHIGDAITRCRVDIRSTIVTTLGAEAIDTLYVTEIAGGSLTPARAEEVASRLTAMLG
ncbi:MAG TPA: [protein-PII] uridylyltransferase [Candidatus Nanopelagicaceae bacterium]|nr:[protein-PII] uridylyltransferase [Candidatus Nanopelagicaceae bacterium]